MLLPLKLPDVRRLLELCDGAEVTSFAGQLLNYIMGRDVFFDRVETCEVGSSMVRPYFARFDVPEDERVDVIGPTSTRYDAPRSVHIYADTIEHLARRLRETFFRVSGRSPCGDDIVAAWDPPRPAERKWTLDRAREVAPHFFDTFADVALVHMPGAIGLACCLPKFPVIACEHSDNRSLPWSKEVSDRAGGYFSIVAGSIEEFTERAHRISFEFIEPADTRIRNDVIQGALRNEDVAFAGSRIRSEVHDLASFAHQLQEKAASLGLEVTLEAGGRINEVSLVPGYPLDVEEHANQFAPPMSAIERVPEFRHPRTKPEVSIVVDDMSGDDVGGDV